MTKWSRKRAILVPYYPVYKHIIKPQWRRCGGYTDMSQLLIISCSKNSVHWCKSNYVALISLYCCSINKLPPIMGIREWNADEDQEGSSCNKSNSGNFEFSRVSLLTFFHVLILFPLHNTTIHNLTLQCIQCNSAIWAPNSNKGYVLNSWVIFSIFSI